MKEYQVFDKYKMVIINEIIMEFGYEYEEYIRRMFNDFKIIFETPPDEEYKYCKDSLIDRGKYYYEYIKLEYLKKKNYNSLVKEHLDKWIEHFVNLNKNDNYERIYKLFYGNEQMIDYFSSSYEFKLNDANVSIKDKKRILDKRNSFILKLNKLGYEIVTLDNKMVDLFIVYRDLYFCRMIIKKLLDEGDNYITRISKIINDDNSEIINDLIKKKEPTCFKYTKKNGGQYRFVYLPINRLRDMGNKTIDVILVHEMIHYIQKFNDKEEIIDEVFVQIKASRIVERLHKKGIFIFDKQDDSKIFGECIYEVLYPFINDIIKFIPLEIINDSIINNQYQCFDEYFGNNINKYILILNRLYNDFVNNNYFNENNLKECERCIKEMVVYYNSRKPIVRKRIIDK